MDGNEAVTNRSICARRPVHSISTGYPLHAAYGTRLRQTRSHGCVNLPPRPAWLFD